MVQEGGRGVRPKLEIETLSLSWDVLFFDGFPKMVLFTMGHPVYYEYFIDLDILLDITVGGPGTALVQLSSLLVGS